MNNRSGSQRDTKRLEEFCKAGEKGDQLLKDGRTREALKAFHDLAASAEGKGDFDSYLAAKLTLGVLRCQVKLGDFKAAYSTWNANLEDSIYGIGIYALESAQTTVRDMLSYDMLCAFLHTLADDDKANTASAVNQYLSRVCEHALEDGDRELMRLSVSNWKQHLREVFGVTVPYEYAKPLIRFEQELGENVKPQPIEFPHPSAWEKPRDFLEMSRFQEMKKVGRPAADGARSPRASGKKKHAV